MLEIQEKDPTLALHARAKGWLQLIGWMVLAFFACGASGSIIPFLPPRLTSLICDRAAGKCTFVDRRPFEFPVTELLGATAAFHQTGGRSNRQYLHHLVLKLAGATPERTLCDAPDDEEDRADDAKIAAEIERFVHDANVPTLSVQCDIGRTSGGTLIAAIINGLILVVVVSFVVRAPVGSVLEIDKSTGTVVFHQQRLAFRRLTTRTTVDQVEGVRTRTVYTARKGSSVRLGAVLLMRDGVNLTVLRPLPTWSSSAQERADAGKKLAAFLNVPVKDESEA